MTTTELTTATDDRALHWRVHPAAERPGALVAALAVIGVFGWLAADWMESWMWGMFAASLMIALLGRFFFPSEYRVDDAGVASAQGFMRQRLRWGEIRRFVHDARGGYLSSRARPTALDTFRGVHLLFADNGPLVIDRIQSRLTARPAVGDLTAAALNGCPEKGADPRQQPTQNV